LAALRTAQARRAPAGPPQCGPACTTSCSSAFPMRLPAASRALALQLASASARRYQAPPPRGSGARLLAAEPAQREAASRGTVAEPAHRCGLVATPHGAAPRRAPRVAGRGAVRAPGRRSCHAPLCGSHRRVSPRCVRQRVRLLLADWARGRSGQLHGAAAAARLRARLGAGVRAARQARRLLRARGTACQPEVAQALRGCNNTQREPHEMWTMRAASQPAKG